MLDILEKLKTHKGLAMMLAGTGLVGIPLAYRAMSSPEDSLNSNIYPVNNSNQTRGIVPPESLNPATPNNNAPPRPVSQQVQSMQGNRVINLDEMNSDDMKRQIDYQARRINTDLITLEELRRLYALEGQNKK